MSSLSDSIQKLRDKLNALGKRGGGGGDGERKSSGGGFDAKKAIAWGKQNPIIVISVAVMVLAPSASWWFSSQRHEEADRKTAERAKEMVALESLGRTEVEVALPGQEPWRGTGVVTPKVVADYEALTRRQREDAVAVQRAALKHNQKGRTRLATDIRVTPNNSSTIAEDVFLALRRGMEQTLQQARVGMPPDPESVLGQVQRRQDQFIAGLKKTDRKSLTPEEQAELRTALTDKCLQVYADTAANISFYGDIATLGLPRRSADAGSPPSEARMFYWQWRVWIIEDLIGALVNANKPYRNVMDSPVKRLVSIAFNPADEVLAGNRPQQPVSAPPMEDGMEGVPQGGSVFQPIDPKMPVPYDFKRVFTGRSTNPLYDVRQIRVTLIVATAGLPDVLNAIARENFMTVVNVDLAPADAFAAAAAGYVYGPDHVSRVTLTIETVWLREWIAKLMPKELQELRQTDGRTIDDDVAGLTSTESQDASQG